VANLFIDRSLGHALDFFKEAVFSDDIARTKGLLQSIDARIKIVLLFAVLVAACLIKTIPMLIVFYLASVFLAVLSGISIIFFLKRVWFFIPIFTLFIAIPAVFTQGIFSAVIFLLRVTTCVSFVVLVTVTTRHSGLLRSLGSLGVPAIFVSVLDMTYRYVFLFIKIFEDMHLSLKSRLIGRFDGRRARHWIAARMTFLFRRSVRMSEDVYAAMIARGYGLEVKKNGK
jgi:cobalt/nickel transport system permease protein